MDKINNFSKRKKREIGLSINSEMNFCESQNIQADIPKMFQVVESYRTSQESDLKRTLI